MTNPDRSGLALGAWQPEIHAALLQLIDEHGANSPGFDPDNPPLAVFDCDESIVYNDLGEAMLRYVVTRRKISADRAFWNLIPDRFGRDAIRAAYNAVAGRMDVEVKDTAAFRRYQAGLIGVYETLRETEGLQEAWIYATRMLRGIHERTMADLVEEVLDFELDHSLGQEDVPGAPPFGGFLVPSGVRVYQEMENLLGILAAYGFQVWIITFSNVYIVRALARRLQIPEERVLGLELQTQSGVLTDRLIEPNPLTEGKLEFFLDTVGRSPLLVVGDSIGDYDLLENSDGLSIVIDKGDEDFNEHVRMAGWFLQSQLSV